MSGTDSQSIAIVTIDKPSIAIREAKEKDHAFIYASWLHTYRLQSSFAVKIPKNIFFDWHHRIIENILLKPTTEVLIAHLEGEPDVMLGFLVIEKWRDTHVVHFTFIKKQFQKMGIATSLWVHAQINPETAHFTHWTFDMDWLKRKYTNLTYDPYKI